MVCQKKHNIMQFAHSNQESAYQVAKKNIVMLTAFIRPIHFDLICKPDVNIIYTYGRASPLHAFYLRIGLVILPVARLQEITMLMPIRPS